MRAKTFKEFRLYREADENEDSGSDGQGLGGDIDPGGVGTKVSLGDGNDLVPFEVSDDPKSEHYGKNKNLAPVVRAFKGGGNWGWSRDDNSGDDKPVKISGKKVYLAGGAVRSHLAGEKARNVEMVTNASPDEVYHLLRQNGFEFVDDKGSINKKSTSPHPNRKEGAKQFFWVNKGNQNGRPFSFGLQVNEDEFELDIMTKTPRGYDNDADDREPGSHADDANGRDFTMNGMYILLTNDNGPNKELVDFHGGIHDMKAGRVKPIGGMEKMGKHPARMVRMARFMHGYGGSDDMSTEDLSAFQSAIPELGKKSGDPEYRKYMMKEFKKGMNKDGKDARKFLKLLAKLGLGDALFPGMHLDTDLPKELSEMHDKHMPLAYMLRLNDPEMLDLGMDDSDNQKVKFLIQSLGMNENMDGGTLDKLTQGYTGSGVSGRKLRDWATKVGGLDPCIMDAFIAHTKSPRVKLYDMDEEGKERISDLFADLIDPFTGQQDANGIEERKQHVELDNFRKHMEYMRPV
jgi:hypothetical protein